MQRFTVALLCNTDKPTLDINALARKFAAVVMGAPYVDAAAVDISIEALQEFSGRYFQASQGPHGQQVELSLCNQQLCIAGTLPLRCIGGGAFVAEGSLLRLQFIEGSSPLQLHFFATGEGSGVLWQRVAE